MRYQRDFQQMRFEPARGREAGFRGGYDRGYRSHGGYDQGYRQNSGRFDQFIDQRYAAYGRPAAYDRGYRGGYDRGFQRPQRTPGMWGMNSDPYRDTMGDIRRTANINRHPRPVDDVGYSLGYGVGRGQYIYK